MNNETIAFLRCFAKATVRRSLSGAFFLAVFPGVPRTSSATPPCSFLAFVL